MKSKIHLLVIISILAFALIATGIPTAVENVYAQGEEANQIMQDAGQSTNQNMEGAGQSANQTGQDIQQKSDEISSKVTEEQRTSLEA